MQTYYIVKPAHRFRTIWNASSLSSANLFLRQLKTMDIITTKIKFSSQMNTLRYIV